MTDIVNGADLPASPDGCPGSGQSSPDQSPQHPWPMVPVLQTLTVLSDGEEMEQMEQKMGIENGAASLMAASGTGQAPAAAAAAAYLDALAGAGLSVTTKLVDLANHHNPSQSNQNQTNQQPQPATNNVHQKRKVGRPITSVKTMNRSFPAVDEIREKLAAGECYVRPRASSSSSDVWALFQEVAYKENHFFTGIVQCKTCHFLTRYHGQITGTSHMRRHACFSLLFPNSTPANRKPKNNQSNASSGQRPSSTSLNNSNQHHNTNNMDADSTTSRNNNNSQNNNFIMRKFKKMSEMSVAAAGQSQQFNIAAPTSNLTIHPTTLPIPARKKFKNNGNSIVPPLHPHERSLISVVNGHHQPTVHHQSMLHRPSMGTMSNGYNSPSSSSATSASSPHHQSCPSPSTNSANSNVPTANPALSTSSSANNLRVHNFKQDLREKLIQFCSEELIPLKSMVSESLRAILQSHMRLCTTQMLQQCLLQQPQMMSLASTLTTTFMSTQAQIPDLEQLTTYLEMLCRHCRDKIKHDVHVNLDNNAGCALVCDSDQDTCILSVYYCDQDWALTETILAASVMVVDINQFVAKTMEHYGLQDRKKLTKFTFVSHGGLFGGVSVCLSSMAHIVDKVVEETLNSVDDVLVNGSENNSLPHLNDLFDSCHELALKYNIQTCTNSPDNIEWIAKYELCKELLQRQTSILQDADYNGSIDFNLLAMIVKLLEPFRTASDELRQCNRHPTLCHVLLYFYKLKKVLATNWKCSMTTQEMSSKESIRKQSMNKKQHIRQTTNRSDETHSDSDDSTEEKDIHAADSKASRRRRCSSTSRLDTEEDEEEDEEQDVEMKQEDDEDCKVQHTQLLLDRMKQLLMDNLVKYYQVQSLHRIATFLWPNFRLLKMLTADEQKEVHEDVRKLIQLRINKSTSANSSSQSNENKNSPTGSLSSNQDQDAGSAGGSLLESTKSRSNFDEWEVFSDQDQDEVDKYLSVQLTSCSETYIMQWWKEHSNEFPKLAQLAKWVLAIPASVTTRERFQITKNRLVDDMLLFLHCNLKAERFDFAAIRKLTAASKRSSNKSSSSSSSTSSQHNGGGHHSKNAQTNHNNSSLIAN